MEFKEENIKHIDIYPTKVGRRILVFLGEIFLTLIISTILFELVIFQISRPIIKYNQITENISSSQEKIFRLLYERELLFYEDNTNVYNINDSLEYTNSLLIKYYVFEDKEDENKEIFVNYVVNYKEDKVDRINELYLLYGEEYFDTSSFTSLGTYKLKEEYKEAFSHNYLEGDEMSTEAYEDFNNFRDNVFVKLFGALTDDIALNDLKSLDGTYSYLSLRNDIEDNENVLQYDYIICSYISFVITCVVLYFVIPLTNNKRQTLIEKILKVERINKNHMSYLKRNMVISVSLFKVIDAMTLMFLIPFLRVGLSYLFSLPILYLPSLVALIIVIINLFITIFTTFNTSLKEITTNSIVVDESSLNQYYEELGYGK